MKVVWSGRAIRHLVALRAYIARDSEHNAARVTTIVHRVTGYDLGPKLRQDLAAAVSGKTGKTGAQMFDEVLEYAHQHKAV